jgi:hypothetical protein
MKTSVSELELRKVIYNPITDIQKRNYSAMQIHKQWKQQLSMRKRKSIMIKSGGNTLELHHKQDHQLKNANNTRIVSCIFKVNDDLRQDIIAL